MRAALFISICLLAGCAQEDRNQTRQDADKLGKDLKQEFKKADAVVTKEAHEAREQVKKGAEKVKKDIHEATK
jgi:hypothetical protein